jgi:hypothetical protein
MFKRMFIQVLNYRWFPVLVIMIAAAMIGAIFISNNPGVTAAAILGFPLLAAAFAGNYVGFYVQPYLTAPTSPLIPGLRTAHAWFALALNAGLSLLLTIAATSAGGPWTNTSRVAVFAAFWCCSTLWLGIGYITHPIFVSSSADFVVWAPSLMFGYFMPKRTLEWLFTYDTQASTAAALFSAGIVLNIFLRTNVLSRRDPIQPPASLDDPASFGSLVWRLFWKRTFDALDSIRSPVSGDFLSQVRLVRLNRQLLPNTALAAMLLAGLCLGKYLYERSGMEAADTSMLWLLYVATIPFLMSVMPGSGRSDFRLLSLLPLQRQDLVVRLGAAALTVSVEIWLAFAAAAFLGALMPFGIGLKSLPSAGFLLASFATHLAVFGIVSLVNTMHGGPKQAAAAAPLFLLLALTAAFVPGPIFPLSAALLAIGLVWASYQIWCRSEIN